MKYNENRYNENMLEKYNLSLTVTEHYLLYLLVGQLDYDRKFYDMFVNSHEIKYVDLKKMQKKFIDYFEIDELESVYLTYYEFYTLALFLELLIYNKKMLYMFYLSVVKRENIKKSLIVNLYKKIDKAIQDNEPRYKKFRKNGWFK